MALSRSSRQYLGVRALLPPDLQTALRTPTTDDKAYVIGTIWLDTLLAESFMYNGGGVWVALGGATTAIATLSGDSGGAIAPVLGDIRLLGTADQITTTGTAGTITFSLPAAVIAPGSLEVTGLLTGDAGATIDSAGTAINIGTDAGTDAINIGTVGNRTVSIGSIADTTVTIGAGLAINIGAQLSLPAINIGQVTPDVTRSIIIGSGQVYQTDTSDTISIASGGSSSATASKILNLGVGEVLLGTNQVNIGTGTAVSGTHAVSISTGVGGGTKTVDIGNADGLTTVTLNADLHFGTEGNKIISDSIAVAAAAGANSFGVITLVAGAVTISTTAITSSSGVILSRQGFGATGVAELGVLSIENIVDGVSFDIRAATAADSTATATSDVSLVAWMIFN
jgi:hypothetical protein